MRDTMKFSFSQAIVFAQVDKIILTLCATCLLPLVVHALSVSNATALGEIWLPIFYAPLLAMIWCRPHVALFAAMLAPTINRLVLGLPVVMMQRILTLELMVFVGVLYLLLRGEKFFILAPLAAYAIARFCAVAAFQILPGNMAWTNAMAFFSHSLFNSLPGLAVLTLLVIWAQRTKKFFYAGN